MKEYIIITAHNLGDLSDSVEAYLNDGWTLNGGMSVSGWFRKTFYQPMIKSESQPIYREKEPVPFKSRSKN